ncbi:speckle-type POZ protein-like isoform X3 [Colias croceus]|uniref:speckle-type POZ protein-like isoform X3 n=1 Tax=Colias crocea TaxID=72248 RepID=UPI001E27D76C|nr:speckle-type POZ protein-like isoform X3 [Colias croceus]
MECKNLVQRGFGNPAYEYRNLIFIKFVKRREEVNFKYNIEFTSRALKIINKNFTSDDRNWRLIYDDKRVSSYTIDVSIVMNILPPASAFASLHKDRDFIDFELRGEDGSVHMHKAVLAASSPVLHRMLGGTWKESTEGLVDVPGTTKTTLEAFKDYLYLHSLPDTGLEHLLLLASYYMMPDLEELCVHKLVDCLRAENACDLLEFAAKHKMTRLLIAILESVQNGEVSVEDMREHFMNEVKNKIENMH